MAIQKFTAAVVLYVFNVPLQNFKVYQCRHGWYDTWQPPRTQDTLHLSRQTREKKEAQSEIVIIYVINAICKLRATG